MTKEPLCRSSWNMENCLQYIHTYRQTDTHTPTDTHTQTDQMSISPRGNLTWPGGGGGSGPSPREISYADKQTKPLRGVNPPNPPTPLTPQPPCHCYEILYPHIVCT